MTNRKPPAPPARGTIQPAERGYQPRPTTIGPRNPVQGGYQPTSEGKPGGPPNKPPGGKPSK